MPKFKVGDEVVPKIKPPLAVSASPTSINFGYNSAMVEMMKRQQNMRIVLVDRGHLVRAGNWNWHPDDLELYHLELENK